MEDDPAERPTPDKAIEELAAKLLEPLRQLLQTARDQMRLGLALLVIFALVLFAFILLVVIVDHSAMTITAGLTAFLAICLGFWIFVLRIRSDFHNRAHETAHKYVVIFNELQKKIIEAGYRIREIRFRSRREIEAKPSEALGELTDSLIRDSLTYISVRRQVESHIAEFETSFARLSASMSARTLLLILAAAFVGLQAFDLVLSFLQYSRVDFDYPDKAAIAYADRHLLQFLHISLYAVPSLLFALFAALSIYIVFGRYLLGFLLSSLAGVRKASMNYTRGVHGMMGEFADIIRALAMEIRALESMLRGHDLPGRA